MSKKEDGSPEQVHCNSKGHTNLSTRGGRPRRNRRTTRDPRSEREGGEQEDEEGNETDVGGTRVRDVEAETDQPKGSGHLRGKWTAGGPVIHRHWWFRRQVKRIWYTCQFRRNTGDFSTNIKLTRPKPKEAEGAWNWAVLASTKMVEEWKARMLAIR